MKSGKRATTGPVLAALFAIAALGAAPAMAQDAAAKDEAVQPEALKLIKDMSDVLTGAETLSFDVTGAFDVPAANGQPLFYYTRSHVEMQRPDKLKVSATADGPPEEFTYDGSEIAVYQPEQNMVARKAAPADLDTMLREAYVTAGLYFPFVDLLVSDPYTSFTGHALSAFVVGKSEIVGGVTTDIVAIADGRVQWQIWIGAEDKLPRLIWSTPAGMPEKPRIMVDFANWKLNEPMQAADFASNAPADAAQIQFARPTAR